MLALSDGGEFGRDSQRLRDAGITSPQADGEWSYPVLDPMGNTIEVYRAFGDEVPAGAENVAVSE